MIRVRPISIVTNGSLQDVTYLWKVGDADASTELQSAVDLLVPEGW